MGGWCVGTCCEAWGLTLDGPSGWWGRHRAVACTLLRLVIEDIGESHGPTRRIARIWEEHETPGGFLLSWEVGQQCKVCKTRDSGFDPQRSRQNCR